MNFIFFLIFAVYFEREQTRFGTRRKVLVKFSFPLLIVSDKSVHVHYITRVTVSGLGGNRFPPKWYM